MRPYFTIEYEGGKVMISYEPFWNTLRERGETTYSLINDHHISSATVNRLRKNMGISTLTINDLCRILHCRVEDVLVYSEDKE